MLSVFTVTNTLNSGAGSLRQAILNANLATDSARIQFNIPVTDPGHVDVDAALPGGDANPDAFVIKPLSALPALTRGGTTIDGRTQTTFSGDTNPFGPEIVLNGSLAGSASGLVINSSNNGVHGLNIQQFAGQGIIFWSGTRSDNVIQGNYIGTDATGTMARANTGHGIAFFGAECQRNLIGTRDGNPALGNIISANLGMGVYMDSALSGAVGNIIAGNYIGTDASGSAALGNAQAGVRLAGSETQVIANVISANRQDGIQCFTTLTDSVIQGNYIGTDATGTVALGNGTSMDPNSGRGIHFNIAAGKVFERNLIGSEDGNPALSNIIAASWSYGIQLGGLQGGTAVTHNIVAGNFIGTDATGTVPMGNGRRPGGASGVILDDSSESNTVVGNTIFYNYGPGFLLRSTTDNAVAHNAIAYNSGAGVAVVISSGGTSTGNSIWENSIYANGGLAIDLDGTGVTPNDPLDADPGPNYLQNFPVIALAEPGATTHVVGTLDSAADTTFTINFYLNDVPDPSGYGEGEQWVGAVNVTTDSLGHAAFDEVLSAESTLGQFLTATATDLGGNTSEFSRARVVNTLPIVSTGGPYTSVEASEVAFDASASSDPDGSTLQYRWDLDGNGSWDTDWSSSPTASRTWNDDWSGTAIVQVSDGYDTVAGTTTVTVANVAPVLAVSGPNVAFQGDNLTFDLVASDVGPVDQAGTFTYRIDWNGDGIVDQTVAGPSTVSVNHTFAQAGTFNVVVTATDKDGGTSVAVIHPMLAKIPVLIDVKPGDSDPSSLNLASNGKITVVLFSTTQFDARSVNTSSVVFAGAAAATSSFEDVDGDGDLDAVFHFRTQETNLQALYVDLLLHDADADGVLDSTRQLAEVSMTGRTTDNLTWGGSDQLNLFLSGKKLRDLLDQLHTQGLL